MERCSQPIEKFAAALLAPLDNSEEQGRAVVAEGVECNEVENPYQPLSPSMLNISSGYMESWGPGNSVGALYEVPWDTFEDLFPVSF